MYDGWETRRRRVAGHDEAIVRLGVPGVVRGVVVDTAWFKGNYPPEISVEAISVDGYPDPADLAVSGEWTTIVERSTVHGDSENPFSVTSEERWTHVKLTIYPDGGVARFRVHGEARPDPRFLDAGPLDLAALENGGRVTDCSNMFYSSPQNILFPGRAASMGDGWETARRRDNGNDWVQVQLAGEGVLSFVEIDTSYFLGNSPGEGALTGRTSEGGVDRTVAAHDAASGYAPSLSDRFRSPGHRCSPGHLPGRWPGAAESLRRTHRRCSRCDLRALTVKLLA